MPIRATIDSAGRLVVPKALRERLGFAPGIELELEEVDGALQISIPSRTRVEEGPHGPRLTTDDEARLGALDVRDLTEHGRRT
ncbi:MAG: AbrB/MazE/SpoVT family DNA-binding domain-containing protein [Solirubrobacterales bacterium]